MTDPKLILESPEKILDLDENISESEESIFWSVVGSNTRVVKDWRALVLKAPENAIRCYKYLRSNPIQRSPGRVFPLRGKKFKGAWEYEITSSDRVFYVPVAELKQVIVYYAGKHPVKNKYPRPPGL